MNGVPMTWNGQALVVSVMHRQNRRVDTGDWVLILKRDGFVQHVVLPTHGREGTESDAVRDAMTHLEACGVVAA